MSPAPFAPGRQSWMFFTQKGVITVAGVDHGVVEIMPMKTADEDVLARESCWKDVLLSREFGLNRN